MIKVLNQWLPQCRGKLMPQSSDGPIENRDLGVSGIVDLLDEETPETIPLEKPAKEPVKEETEETTEEETEKEPEIKLADEDDDEEKEPEINEEELEIIAPAKRSEILKAFPDLFKKFPHLEKAYYRDQKYSELFGTPQDAEQVIETAKTFNQFSDNLLKGNTENVLKSVREQNPEAFGKIVDNYLTTLKEVDERAFYHVVQNTLKSTVAAMVSEASRSDNQDLLAAARLLHQFATGTTEWKNPESFSKVKPKEDVEQENELAKERMQFFQERFETVQGELQSRVDGVLKNTIDQNMDPKGSMTSYVKRVAVNEAMQTVQKQISSDSQFRRLLDRLWEKAAEDKFSKQSTEKIRSAYLAKAKSLLPNAIKQSRNEALRGLGKRVREETDETSPVRNPTAKRESATPQTLRGSNSRENASKGKSTFEFLNED
jgi:hypothetical protein